MFAYIMYKQTNTLPSVQVFRMSQLLPTFCRSVLLATLFLASSPQLSAQTFRIITNDFVNTCTGNFVDGGGLVGPHTTGTEQSITICAQAGSAPNTHIRVTFEQFEINGTMVVYNDNNADDPNDVLITYDPNANGTFPIVTATAANSSGCLTFVFNGTGPASAGWNGIISCETACQPVIATIFDTDPDIMPVDTGYIDVCLYDTVSFVGGGIYPEDNIIYDQDDATSKIDWFFSDGVEFGNATNVQRTFTEPGGYLVSVRVTDVNGCINTNLVRQRIRVAPVPEFNLQTDFVTDVCFSDTIVLAGSTEVNPNPNSQVFVSSDSVGFPIVRSLADTTFLPDGNNEMYQSTLSFTNFNPGATLTSLNDLVSICLNMEHSYAGDLDLYIECPNGSTATFIDFNGPGLGGQYLGIPIDVDQDLSPGIGYDYCFIPDPSLLSISEQAIMNGTDVNNSIVAGNYNADSDAEWNNLIGCPLNGDWIIHVQDNLFSDNGYIFSWSIEFNNRLYPDAETFFVGVEDHFWVAQENLVFYDPDSIRAIANYAGENAYTYIVVDSFGCIYDTTLTVNVAPFTSPDCYSCQSILDSTAQSVAVCTGTEVQTTLASRVSLDTLIPWAAFPSDTFTNSRYFSLGTSYNSTISVSDIRPLMITDAATSIASICVDLGTEHAGDIRLFLQTPTGGLFELSTGNGGTDPDYINTCFTPDAMTSITDGTAPFEGNFLPETDFSFLNGNPINGDWTLRAYDVSGGDAFGVFLGWSITFRNENLITYNWTPDDGTLSCTDCPDPVITSNGSQTYTVTATDLYGCSETGMVFITLGDLPADITVDVTSPGCGQTSGSATVAVDPNAGYQFSWSHGPSTQTVDDLPPGMYTVTISAGSCEITRDITVEQSVPIEITLDSVDDLSCNGSSDGQINVTVTGGVGDLSYAWNDPNSQILEDAVFLNAGTYTLVVTDENGCTANITATVNEPDPLSLSFETTEVNCNGGSDGTATVTPAGGNGGYQFAWSNGGDAASIQGVGAGNYVVTVTDNKGCMIVDSVSVGQPAASVALTTAQDQMGCSGASLNVASVAATGGHPPYTYSWSSGATTATATGLPAGPNTVTVTDVTGCGITAEIQLTDLEPITFNIFSTNPSCNGYADGAMGVNLLMGGAGTTDTDYSFNWSSGSQDITADNLAGGVEYSLTVTDQQGCTTEQTRFLDQPAPVQLTTTENSVSCFGLDDGTISIVSITGPNPGGYNIQWNAAAGNSTDSTVMNLGAGSYTVQITDSEGCIADRTVVLTEPTQLQVELDKTDVTCFGDIDGNIRAAASGGTPDYSYSWSNGNTNNSLSNLPAGSYQLVLTDANGCEETREISIEQPPEIFATATAEDVICNGDATGRITITGGGGRPPFTYGLQGTGFSRSNEFIGLLAGDYTVFVRDIGGCLGTTEIAVNDGPEFIVDLGEDINIVYGDSINLEANFTGAAGDLLFSWSGSYDGTLLCPGDTIDRANNVISNCPSPNARPEYEIDYLLRLIDGNGCEAEDRLRVSVQKIRVVEVPSGFTPNSDGQNDRLLVHGRPGTTVKRFSVFDRWGELIFEDADFPVNDLSRGWDGNYKNEVSSAGVYVWQVVAIYEDGSEELLTGYTSLIR